MVVIHEGPLQLRTQKDRSRTYADAYFAIDSAEAKHAFLLQYLPPQSEDDDPLSIPPAEAFSLARSSLASSSNASASSSAAFDLLVDAGGVPMRLELAAFDEEEARKWVVQLVSVGVASSDELNRKFDIDSPLLALFFPAEKTPGDSAFRALFYVLFCPVTSMVFLGVVTCRSLKATWQCCCRCWGGCCRALGRCVGECCGAAGRCFCGCWSGFLMCVDALLRCQCRCCSCCEGGRCCSAVVDKCLKPLGMAIGALVGAPFLLVGFILARLFGLLKSALACCCKGSGTSGAKGGGASGAKGGGAKGGGAKGGGAKGDDGQAGDGGGASSDGGAKSDVTVATTSAASAIPEKRIDPSDGVAYTKDEFVAYLGAEAAEAAWEAAARQEPGRSEPPSRLPAGPGNARCQSCAELGRRCQGAFASGCSTLLQRVLKPLGMAIGGILGAPFMLLALLFARLASCFKSGRGGGSRGDGGGSKADGGGDPMQKLTICVRTAASRVASALSACPGSAAARAQPLCEAMVDRIGTTASGRFRPVAQLLRRLGACLGRFAAQRQGYQHLDDAAGGSAGDDGGESGMGDACGASGIAASGTAAARPSTRRAPAVRGQAGTVPSKPPAPPGASAAKPPAISAKVQSPPGKAPAPPSIPSKPAAASGTKSPSGVKGPIAEIPSFGGSKGSGGGGKAIAEIPSFGGKTGGGSGGGGKAIAEIPSFGGSKKAAAPAAAPSAAPARPSAAPARSPPVLPTRSPPPTKTPPIQGSGSSELPAEPERRIDPSDGVAYTKDEFVAYLGAEAAEAAWEAAARQEPAKPAAKPAAKPPSMPSANQPQPGKLPLRSKPAEAAAPTAAPPVKAASGGGTTPRGGGWNPFKRNTEVEAPTGDDEPERRVDPSDGVAYTKDEFVAYLGAEAAEAAWEAAARQEPVRSGNLATKTERLPRISVMERQGTVPPRPTTVRDLAERSVGGGIGDGGGKLPPPLPGKGPPALPPPRKKPPPAEIPIFGARAAAGGGAKIPLSHSAGTGTRAPPAPPSPPPPSRSQDPIAEIPSFGGRKGGGGSGGKGTIAEIPSFRGKPKSSQKSSDDDDDDIDLGKPRRLTAADLM